MIKVARFRFGNKMKERRYWERDEKKVEYMGGRKKHDNTHTHSGSMLKGKEEEEIKY